MSIKRDMPAIDKALNRASWEWLQTEDEALAEAVSKEVSKRTPPDAIYRHILNHVGIHRDALARRVKQAAEHLQNGDE